MSQSRAVNTSSNISSMVSPSSSILLTVEVLLFFQLFAARLPMSLPLTIAFLRALKTGVPSDSIVSDVTVILSEDLLLFLILGTHGLPPVDSLAEVSSSSLSFPSWTTGKVGTVLSSSYSCSSVDCSQISSSK